MSEFPTSDADIKALRVKILQALAASPHPRMAIGSIAGKHGLTVDDVKSLVKDYGWPEPQDMRRHWIEIEGGKPLPDAHRPPPAPAAQGNGTERLLDAGDKSERPSTRKLAAKLRGQLNQLREMVIAERKEREAAEAEAARQELLRSEVDKLEQELAEKRAALKGTARLGPQRDAKAIREWAAANSVACQPFGRVPREVVEAYELATKAAS